MNHVSALVILLLLLFGPLAIKSIEHNIELYCLGLGILATYLGTGFSQELVNEAMHEPVAISIAVIVAALLFGWSESWLERILGRLRARGARPCPSASAGCVIAS